MRVEVGPVELVEPAGFALLLTEKLNDTHPGQTFLQERVYPRQTNAYVPVGVAHRFPKQARDENDERNDCERGESEPPIQEQHCHADCDERKKVTEPGDHAGCEQLVQRLDIRSDARDEPPRRVSVEERDRQTLKMTEYLHPDVAHHTLAEEAGEPGLGIGERELRDQKQQKESGRDEDDVHVPGRHGNVDDAFGEQRTSYLNAALDAEQSESAIHERAIRTRIRQQTPHEMAVVCFAEHVVFVCLGCGGSHSAVC
jgi:hypothetical protein